jgi:hypothetical protein
MTPLVFTDNQLAEVLRRARVIESDADRDQFFRAVADVLRDTPNIDDSAVRKAVGAAFASFNPHRSASR